MNEAKRWLLNNWKMILGVLIGVILWTMLAVNTGSGLGF